MKTSLLALFILALAAMNLAAQPRPALPGHTFRAPPTQPSAAPAEEMIPPGTIDFTSADVSQVLDIYAKLVNRTILRPASLPGGQIVLKTQTPLTKKEAIEALQAVLALNGVAVINVGEKFAKAVPVDQANSAGAAFSTGSVTNLPDLGSYITRIVQLKYVKPSEMLPILTPFAKLPNSIFAVDANGILVIRDYAENVKRMMEMIDKIDISVPAEYVSEVIPIRYAKVDDIADALNSLGGGGGATVRIGTAPSSTQISGLHGGGLISGMNSGMGGGIGGMNTGMGGFGGSSSYVNRTVTTPTTNPNGTPTGGSTFAQRLNNIIQRASGGGGGEAGQQPIQLFGQTKIIPDESSSSLLVYATRQDMATIKDIISKLDVPLAQVLIEAVVIDYSLGPNTFNFGVSAAQNPKTYTGSSPGTTQITGGGGMNNGQTLLNLLNTSSLTNSVFGNNLGGGLSYFGNIGPNWDVAIAAAASDSHASIIQRPRIQTSQAKPAQFFVGDTVPYVTSTYNYGGAYGNQSSYSQLSVGVELDVTPYINPDGVVSMDIQQEIDDLNGYTTITGVGDVPNTIKRTLNTSITVRDHDTVMLGGFIKSSKSTSKSGVPFLEDIPLLGNLFSSRSDKKAREELIVLMRPTVLKTPLSAAQNTIAEAQRLPGVSAAYAAENAEENKLVNAERRKELKKGSHSEGFFNMKPVVDTNAPAPEPEPTPVSTTTPDQTPQPDQSSATSATPALVAPVSPAENVTPAQAAQLQALVNRYAAGKITTEEYQAARQKILAENRQ